MNKMIVRFRVRRRWRREESAARAQIDALTRESVAGLHEVARIRVTLNQLFEQWEVAKMCGGEFPIKQIAALQDRRDALLTREGDLQFKIARIQYSIAIRRPVVHIP